MSTSQKQQKGTKENPYVAMRKYKGNNLYLIVDLNSCHWMEKSLLGLEGLLILMSQTMNSHLIKSIYNSVFVFVMNSRNSKMIFPLENYCVVETQQGSDKDQLDNMNYAEIQRRIEKRIYEFMSTSMVDNINYSLIIPAITQALCKINKNSILLEKKQANQIENEKYYSSILIFTVSEIHSSSYISLMSAIETSIKHKVSIFVLELPGANLTKNTTDYLKQLCSLTSGYFNKDGLKDGKESSKESKESSKEGKENTKDGKDNNKESKDSLSLVNPFDLMNHVTILMLTSGDMIAKPEQQLTKNPVYRPSINEKVSFRVNCSCHNTPIETNTAYVCSDCLFLYCKQNENNEEVCKNCADIPLQ